MTVDELLIAELRAQRESLQRHFESLDSKAGIVVGFAGVLATIAPTRLGAVVQIGRGLAIVAAILAVTAFVPRRFPALHPTLLTPAQVGNELSIAEERVRFMISRSLTRSSTVLHAKEAALRAAMVTIVAAASVLGGSIIILGGSG